MRAHTQSICAACVLRGNLRQSPWTSLFCMPYGGLYRILPCAASWPCGSRPPACSGHPAPPASPTYAVPDWRAGRRDAARTRFRSGDALPAASECAVASRRVPRPPPGFPCPPPVVVWRSGLARQFWLHLFAYSMHLLAVLLCDVGPVGATWFLDTTTDFGWTYPCAGRRAVRHFGPHAGAGIDFWTSLSKLGTCNNLLDDRSCRPDVHNIPT